jgi:hypothetical protein
MSRIRIQAAGSPGVAEDGGTAPLLFTASLTDHDGDPVRHLGLRAFDVHAPVVGPGGTPFRLSSATEVAPGVYVLEVSPRDTWNDGEYLFVLTVEHGGDRGQTVFPVTVPEEATV